MGNASSGAEVRRRHWMQVNPVAPDHAAVGKSDVTLPWPRLCLHGACPVPPLGHWTLDLHVLVDRQGRELPGPAVVASSNFLVSLGGTLLALRVRLLLCLKGAWMGRNTSAKGVAEEDLCR